MKNPFEIWFENFVEKRGRIVSLLPKSEIANYFRYDNMQKYHSDFCPLFETGELCHSGIDRAEFSCYHCGCPFFDYENEFGGCKIDSPDGKRTSGNLWDCSACSFVHKIGWMENFQS
jgi:Zn-finger protein